MPKMPEGEGTHLYSIPGMPADAAPPQVQHSMAKFAGTNLSSGDHHLQRDDHPAQPFESHGTPR